MSTTGRSSDPWGRRIVLVGIVLVLAALAHGCFPRYESAGDGFRLDRWTGKICSVGGRCGPLGHRRRVTALSHRGEHQSRGPTGHHADSGFAPPATAFRYCRNEFREWWPNEAVKLTRVCGPAGPRQRGPRSLPRGRWAACVTWGYGVTRAARGTIP